ncbi:A24 family peptidase [Sphingobium estronivorans]|uniref:A24 family peptidase n=1 Tax=Sphingobium estronivorans TaxID=1577690 RepID=UPI00123BD8E1|nr:prepilin peptidase [Sphingobium estronivorans]
MTFFETASLIFLIGACVAAGVYDLYQRRIPNWLCILTMIAGLAAAPVEGGLSALNSHAIHLVVALIGGMLLFKLGAFGGGDAKFYAAAAAWFNLGKGSLLLMSVASCGLVLLVIWFIVRRMQGKPVRRSSDDPGSGLPYGVAIGAGTILMKLVFN